MLTVTTDNDVGLLGLPGYGPVDEPSEPSTAKLVNVPDGVKRMKIYIHGDAERAAGFDIPLFRTGTLDLARDEQPCQLVTPYERAPTIDCTLHIWRTVDETLMCGFIIADTDVESIAYAQKCRAARKKYL